MPDWNGLLRFLAQRYPSWRGKYRLTEYAIRHVSGKTLHTDRFGSRLLLDLDNYIDSVLFVKGEFEAEAMTALARQAEELNCRTFIDVGANFGLFAVFMAQKAWCSRVHAFEPDPRNFAQLLANLFLNDLCDRVVAHPVALSAEDGRSRFRLARARHSWDFGKFNSGMSEIATPEAPGNGEETVLVETRRLDGILAPAGEAIAIKIDVEGHELEVLRGMRGMLERNRCVVLMETFRERREAALSMLGELGYKEAGGHVEPPDFLLRKDQ